jgi:hypothetical protein
MAQTAWLLTHSTQPAYTTTPLFRVDKHHIGKLTTKNAEIYPPYSSRSRANSGLWQQKLPGSRKVLPLPGQIFTKMKNLLRKSIWLVYEQ